MIVEEFSNPMRSANPFVDSGYSDDGSSDDGSSEDKQTIIVDRSRVEYT